MDKALQQLYWACRQKSEFPGEVPDESTGAVTTDAILEGLGLMRPPPEAPHMPHASEQQESMKTKDQVKPCHVLHTPPTEPDSAQNDPTLTPSSSFVTSPSTYHRRPTCSASLQRTPLCEEDFNIHTSKHWQIVSVSPQASTCDHNTPPNTVQPATKISGDVGDVASFMDTDKSLYAGSYTIAAAFGSASNFSGPRHWDTGQAEEMGTWTSKSYPVPQGTICDTYVAPWPGALAGAYQSIVPV